MNIEREYYENDDFWKIETLGPHDSKRVAALIAGIPDSVEDIVEVGCGNGIFVNALKSGSRQGRTIIGIDRALSALKYVRAPSVCASIDALPLPDRSFDLVAALEILEHLPVKVYEAGLAEICRLSRRYVMVSVPYKQDLRLSLIECPSCLGQFNPDYHMRSFDEGVLEKLLVNSGFACVRAFTIAPFQQFKGIAQIRAATRRRAPASNPFPTAIPCPICGFYLEPAVSSAGATGSASSNGEAPANGRGIKSMIKKMWPQETSFVWIAALYERASAKGQ